MEEEAITVETVKELAKTGGLRRYIWIYFLLVPLAASTASAVAIIIAALQGLSSHELASRIYAMTLMVGFKAIAIIGSAYLIGLIFALATAWYLQTRSDRIERRTRHLQRERAAAPEVLEFQRDFAERQNRLAAVLLPGAVLYSAGFLIAGVHFWLWQDVRQVWGLLSDIAHPPISDTISLPASEIPKEALSE